MIQSKPRALTILALAAVLVQAAVPAQAAPVGKTAPKAKLSRLAKIGALALATCGVSCGTSRNANQATLIEHPKGAERYMYLQQDNFSPATRELRVFDRQHNSHRVELVEAPRFEHDGQGGTTILYKYRDPETGETREIQAHSTWNAGRVSKLEL